MSNNSSDSSSDSLVYCFESTLNIYVFTTFFTINSSFTPLFIFVLYIGYQRWVKQRSVSTVTTTSNLDVFTYNVVVLEVVFLLACCFYCNGLWTSTESMLQVGRFMLYFASPGQSLFHVLMCVEHYLAVVHPITYLSVKQAGRVRTRICIGCVWLLCFTVVIIAQVTSRSTLITVQCCILVFFLSIVSFCSFSVLHILIRPGPGHPGRDREHVDQSKRRAFYTITLIMGVLWMRFVGVIISSLLTKRLTHMACALVQSAVWLVMPGTLVLSLLFLHRAGKLPVCKRSTEAE